ncbi:hypothetical protein KUTeg_021662 [Tegillarca granosa]|uniref:RING-type domain-containing protein n=1 Tax=Tegillarca granosa TaxID=220873 RepID=A0ABQ9E3Z4_TEGGR|nr:hypothetical protein KUTeg_021662 [Tegillarca granosa]
MEGIGQFLQLSFSCACTVLRCAKDSIISILEVNYDVVSTTIFYISVFLDMLSKILNIASVVFVNIFSAFFDFVLECSHFFSAFFTLMWKFSLLVVSFLNLIFRCLEQLCYCLWSGGIWTLETVSSSWLNFKFTSINLYEYMSNSVYSLFSSVYGGLHLVGYFTMKGVISLCYAIKFLFVTSWELLDDSMDLFDRSVRYVTNNIYFFLTKFIPGLSKEAYLGVLICTITYFFIVNLYNILSTRGMTFPFFSRPETKQQDPDELAREVEHEREKQKCVVCQDEHKSVLILPCRHMCLCVNCGNKIARSRNVDRRICPLCRQRIRTIMNVYTRKIDKGETLAYTGIQIYRISTQCNLQNI